MPSALRSSGWDLFTFRSVISCKRSCHDSNCSEGKAWLFHIRPIKISPNQVHIYTSIIVTLNQIKHIRHVHIPSTFTFQRIAFVESCNSHSLSTRSGFSWASTLLLLPAGSPRLFWGNFFAPLWSWPSMFTGRSFGADLARGVSSSTVYWGCPRVRCKSTQEKFMWEEQVTELNIQQLTALLWATAQNQCNAS